MSIKPIDYINTISKSQEISKIKEIENHKAQNQIEQGVIHQQKNMEKNLKTVVKTNKSEYKIVDKYDKNKENKRNKKKKDQKKREKKYNSTVGREIDIEI